MSDLEIFDSRDALYDAACEALRSAAHDGLTAKGRASLALAGGSTPAPVYQRLSHAIIAWEKVTILLTDERQAPADHPDSNERMLRATLFQNHAAAARFAPMQDDLIMRHRPFDAVLLGMGEDGHFASLFPRSPVLTRGLDLVSDQYVLSVPAGDPAPPQPRYSLTLHALSGAGAVILLITGDAKRAVLGRARADNLPVASLIRALGPRILWAA
jgi:6-phosphogluconolactonase